MSKVFQICEQVIALDKHAQFIKLKELCGDDQSLLNEVEAILCQADGDYNINKNAAILVDDITSGHLQPTFFIKKVIGNYQVQKLIGEGAFSYVFEAIRVDGFLDETLAIKIIKPEFAEYFDYDFINSEARLIAQLEHNNIVRFSDFGILDIHEISLPWYAMPLVHGCDIYNFFSLFHHDSFVKKLTMCVTLCDALQHLHSKSLIHADLKPENLLIDTSTNTLKVLDFGVSIKIIQSTAKNRLKTSYKYKNEGYAQVHSTDYSAPELAYSSQITAAADIYSTGIILYQLITGLKPPFDIAKNLPSALLANTAPHKYKGWLKELDYIILKCINDDPQKRYQCSSDVSYDINQFLALSVLKSDESNRFYGMKKAFIRTPFKYLSYAAATVLISFTLNFSIYSIYTNNFKNHELALSERLRPLENKQFFSDDSTRYKKLLSRAHLLIEYYHLNPALADQQLVKYLDISLNENYYELSVSIYEKLSLLSTNSSLFTSRIIEAYQHLGKESVVHEHAKRITDNFDLNRASTLDVENIIDLSFIDYRLTSDSLYDKTYIALLTDIHEKFSSVLTSEYKAKLLYLQSVEAFYHNAYDPISPSAGYSKQEFELELKPHLTQGLTLINEAISLNNKSDLHLLFSSLKARLLNELGFYSEAISLASTVQSSIKSGSINRSPLKLKILRGLLTVYRFNDLEESVNVLQLAQNHSLHSSYTSLVDDLILTKKYLISSYLNIGDKVSAERELTLISNIYKKQKEKLSFKGLEAISSAIINYYEFTSFEQSNFSKEISAMLSQVTVMLKNNYSEYMSDYEYDIARFYANTVNGYSRDNSYELIKKYLLTNKYNVTVTNQVLLNMSIISIKSGNTESASLFISLAEQNTTTSTLEENKSTELMHQYIQFASTYKLLGKHQKHDEYLAKAKNIYQNHTCFEKNNINEFSRLLSIS